MQLVPNKTTHAIRIVTPLSYMYNVVLMSIARQEGLTAQFFEKYLAYLSSTSQTKESLRRLVCFSHELSNAVHATLHDGELRRRSTHTRFGFDIILK